jgi:hypothetical protein
MNKTNGFRDPPSCHGWLDWSTSPGDKDISWMSYRAGRKTGQSY